MTNNCFNCVWTRPEVFDGTCPEVGELSGKPGDGGFCNKPHDCFVSGINIPITAANSDWDPNWQGWK